MVAALFGLTGVAMGAFAAHAIAGEQAKAWVETGAKYQLAHVMAALASVSFRNWGAPRATIAAPFFFAGIVLFCGALYALALGAPRSVAALAPVGGVAFMVGWAILAWAGWHLWRHERAP
jgi:uncharacterized membrane protein YgdD (TMEM256/DUF423 family)